MRTGFARASIAGLTLLCASVALSGCAQPNSSRPFLTSRSLIVQGPPTARVVPGVVGRYDGLYQGPANAIFTGGGTCPGVQQVADFHVTDNLAEWGGYNGTIDPNGQVEMHHGFEYLTGAFRGDQFIGQLETDAWSSGPSCVYIFNLRRVAA